MTTARLFNAQQGHSAFAALWREAKALLLAGHRLVVTIKPETRSLEQNALLHAALADVADQVEWAGQKRDVETWKRLMTAAWCRTKGEPVSILPAIDGNGIDIVFRRTSALTKAECSDLCEYVFAWGAERGVKFTAPEPT